MAAMVSKMTVAVDPPRAIVKITGRAAVEGARDFKALVLRLSGEGVHHFVLELGDCPLMDSTFSGVLAGLATTHFHGQSRQASDRFTVVNANERITDLLDNLGVLPLIEQVHVRMEAGPGEQISLTSDPGSHQEVTACCLEAHRILMALKPENVAKFKAVEQVLVATLRRSDPGAGAAGI
jgi:anti-anti-sigma regulatory factor